MASQNRAVEGAIVDIVRRIRWASINPVVVMSPDIRSALWGWKGRGIYGFGQMFVDSIPVSILVDGGIPERRAAPGFSSDIFFVPSDSIHPVGDGLWEVGNGEEC